jgi:uncharacterized protein (DUF1697 family)
MRYIAILRGINVGGNRKVPMAELKAACQKTGFQNVRTYIQSGNVFFDVEEQGISGLEVKIKEIIAKTFGFDVPVIVRTTEEWSESIANNPFWKGKDLDIDRLHLTFLKDFPVPEKLEKISTFAFPSDKFEIIGKDVFIFCSAGYSDSKLTNQFFESKLGVQATTRNWKTVIKLNELVLSNI